MESLIVTPVIATDRLALAGTLRRAVGSARLVSGGILIPSFSAPLLMDRHDGLNLTWTEAAHQYTQNRALVLTEHGRVRGEVERIKGAGAIGARPLLRDLDDASRLDEHQIVNVAAMCVAGSPGLCVFDEQGAGKTVTVIFAFDLLAKRHEADIMLVVAPKSMVPEWPRDLARFKGDLYRVCVVSGIRREKRAALRRPADCFFTNFDTAVALEDDLTGLLRARDGRAVLVIDESFFVKNLDARRTQALRRLREWCGRAFVLCGTPAPNRPDDLIQQFNVVDFGITFEGVDVPDDRHAAITVVQRAIEGRGLYVR
ncbi:MAG: SNF2-related protein, partial [bacterium]